METNSKREDFVTRESFADSCAVSRETLGRLQLYAEILTTWQRSINLVSDDSLNEMWHRHFMDSAQLIASIPAGEAPVLDIGSGAGFPGVVLALVGQRPVELVERNGKKCAFLREVGRQTGAPITVHQTRIENLNTEHKWSVITARACAPLSKLLELTENLIAHDGVCIFPKGGGWRDELTNSAKLWNMNATHDESRTSREGVILKISKFSRRHDN